MMYELQQFHKKYRIRGSLRKALEDGRLRPIAFKLPKMVERSSGESCSSTSSKLVLAFFILSLIAMLGYALWRIRDIEEPSERGSNEFDYRIIGPDVVGHHEIPPDFDDS